MAPEGDGDTDQVESCSSPQRWAARQPCAVLVDLTLDRAAPGDVEGGPRRQEITDGADECGADEARRACSAQRLLAQDGRRGEIAEDEPRICPLTCEFTEIGTAPGLVDTLSTKLWAVPSCHGAHVSASARVDVRAMPYPVATESLDTRYGISVPVTTGSQLSLLWHSDWRPRPCDDRTPWDQG